MFDRVIHKGLNIPYNLNLKVVRKGRSPEATIIFLHGLASTNKLWKDLLKNLPQNVKILAVDLLGHGKSPKPEWIGAQSLKMQSRALKRSLLKAGALERPIILVGHSLGALIAADFAKRYPHKINSLVLVSPPVYKPDDKTAWPREKFLKMNYKFLIKNRQFAAKITKFATKNFIKGADEISTTKDFFPLVESLEVAILGQDSFQTLTQIKIDTKILYGLFDPLVVGRNLKEIAKKNSHISTELIPATHDIIGPMKRFVVKTIDENLKEENND